MTLRIHVERALFARLVQPLDAADPDGLALGVPVRRLTADEVATLVADAVRRDQRAENRATRARSVLAVVARAQCEFVLRSAKRDTPPGDAVDPLPDDVVIAVAMLDVVPGFGWRAGRLHDVHHALPDTILASAPGRPLGDLIEAPGIDGTLPMRACHGVDDTETGGKTHVSIPTESTTAVIATDLDVVTLEIPSRPRRILARFATGRLLARAIRHMDTLRSSPECGPGNRVPPWGRGRPEPGRIYTAPTRPAPAPAPFPPSVDGPWDDGYSNMELLMIKHRHERGFNEYGHPF